MTNVQALYHGSVLALIWFLFLGMLALAIWATALWWQSHHTTVEADARAAVNPDHVGSVASDALKLRDAAEPLPRRIRQEWNDDHFAPMNPDDDDMTAVMSAAGVTPVDWVQFGAEFEPEFTEDEQFVADLNTQADFWDLDEELGSNVRGDER